MEKSNNTVIIMHACNIWKGVAFDTVDQALNAVRFCHPKEKFTRTNNCLSSPTLGKFLAKELVPYSSLSELKGERII